MEPRITHMNRHQTEFLLAFMQRHSDVAKGKPSPRLSGPKEFLGELWESFTVEINNRGPPVRNSKAWKKVWSDYKYNIKRKLKYNQAALSKNLPAKRLNRHEQLTIEVAGINLRKHDNSQHEEYPAHLQISIKEEPEITHFTTSSIADCDDLIDDEESSRDHQQPESSSCLDQFNNTTDNDNVSNCSTIDDTDILSNHSLDEQIKRVNKEIRQENVSVKDEFHLNNDFQLVPKILSDLNDIKSTLFETNLVLKDMSKHKEEKFKFYKRIELKKLQMKKSELKIRMMELEVMKQKIKIEKEKI